MKQYFYSFFHYILLFTLLAAFVWFSDSSHPIRIELQHAVFDQFNKAHPREARDDVVIVDIDEDSLKALGQWPWSRKTMAELTTSLTEKGAKVIAFDGVFAEKDRTSPQYYLSQLSEDDFPELSQQLKNRQDAYDYDLTFARAIKESGVFVTAFTYGETSDLSKPLDKKRILARSHVKDAFINNASKFNGAAINLPQLSKSAAGNGSFMAKPDADGVLRRAGMLFSDDQTLYPSLSLEALRVGLSGKKGMVYITQAPLEGKSIIDTAYRVLLKDKQVKIPVEQDGILYVYYRHFCTAQDIKNRKIRCEKQDYVSAFKLLDERYAEESKNFVKDKIVLIGASAEGLKDLRSTPLRPFRPGVEVHANVIEQVLSEQYLLRPSITKGVEALFIIVVGASFIILSAFTGVLISVLLCATLISVASFGAYVMYIDYGLLLDPVYPSISVLMIFILSTVLSYARAEMKRKQIRGAFGMYVAQDVMRDLEANPEKLRLGGERRDITVMFTDIRKFTTISEGLSPEELINLMNEFLTAMTDTVMNHQGTIDKYIGDAMMCFWNAPKDIDNHEREACLAALEMQGKLEPINEHVKKRAIELGKEPVLLRAGIGINSGECAVGNMGSKQRFAYSALGDTVNMASRLEGQTKQYGVNILIGEKTYHHVTDMAVIELDQIKVVGKTKPERIYALLGDEDFAAKAAFENWSAAHNKMLENYRSQNFKAALDDVKLCKTLAKEQGKALYNMYEERINALIKTPPANDWDGVYISTVK